METEKFLSFKLKKSLRKQLAEVLMMPRYLTAGKRALPKFLIIGAQKAGTTSLYEYLVEHPDILPTKTKEVHYFDENYHRGTSWYRSYFPLEELTDNKITGEASPLYIFRPEVPQRVKALLPDVKIILLLRDPAKRAISHIHHMKRKGLEKRSLDELFADGFDARLHAEDALTDPWRQKIYSYLSRGLYARQLKEWFRYFDREQFLILKSEDLYKDTAGLYAKTLDFLEMHPYGGVNFEKAHNQHAYKRPDEELLASLQQWYKPHNDELEALLGRSMDWATPQPLSK